MFGAILLKIFKWKDYVFMRYFERSIQMLSKNIKTTKIPQETTELCIFFSGTPLGYIYVTIVVKGLTLCVPTRFYSRVGVKTLCPAIHKNRCKSKKRFLRNA